LEQGDRIRPTEVEIVHVGGRTDWSNSATVSRQLCCSSRQLVNSGGESGNVPISVSG
jgi:hypothetical protein